MSEKTEGQLASDEVVALEDEAVAALLRRAAPRPMPSKLQQEAIRQAVHLEWQATVGKRRRRDSMLFAIAASVVVAVLALTMVSQNTPQPISITTVASISRQFGNVEMSPAAVNNPSGVTTGQTIVTGEDSGMALAWTNGGSLRLDRNTRLRVESAEEIYLMAGRVYFDSHPAVADLRLPADDFVLAINTPAGLVTPLGTRYLTDFANGELTVAVREGEVVIESDRVRQHASAREQIVVAPNGIASRSRVEPFGGAWSFVEDTGPAFESEGRTVFDFLAWVGRESGREIHFRNADIESIARRTAIVGFGTLHAAPTASLSIVMPSTGLKWQLRGGAIEVYP